jgi:hypothetical protein
MKIAVLIDGDNAESSLLQSTLEEAGRDGKVSNQVLEVERNPVHIQIYIYVQHSLSVYYL